MVPLSGPDNSIDNSREEWVAYQQKADTKEGNISADFQGEGQIKAQLESGLTKLGPQFRFYDPEISALLAGEL